VVRERLLGGSDHALVVRERLLGGSDHALVVRERLLGRKVKIAGTKKLSETVR
jgi:hypothetical protein